jgi:hypothetical protein
VEIWVDGNRYEGTYDKGRKSGKGKYFWNDGSKYDGDWVDNKINGRGIYMWQMEESTRGTGRIIKCMDMENTSGQMVENMKDSIVLTKRVELVNLYG